MKKQLLFDLDKLKRDIKFLLKHSGLVKSKPAHFSFSEMYEFIKNISSPEELAEIEAVVELMTLDGDFTAEQSSYLNKSIKYYDRLLEWIDAYMHHKYYPLFALTNHINNAKSMRDLDAIKLHLQLNQDEYKKNGIWIHSYYIKGLFEVKNYQLETNHFDHDTTIR